MTDESIELLQRWQDGDEQAAALIFDRYVQRLLALASSRLSQKMRRRIDPEDVVQSACRSFFRNVAADRYTFEEGNPLWGLLASIVVNKVRTHVKHHSAGKRNVGQEASLAASNSCYGLPPEDVASEPTADEAVALVEQFDLVAASCLICSEIFSSCICRAVR